MPRVSTFFPKIPAVIECQILNSKFNTYGFTARCTVKALNQVLKRRPQAESRRKGNLSGKKMR